MKSLNSLSLLILASAFSLVSPSHAAVSRSRFDAKWNQVKQTHQEVYSGLIRGDLSRPTELGLRELVSEAVAALRDAGYAKDAERVETEWQRWFAPFLGRVGGIGTFDLGDHQPVNEWFGVLYQLMRDRLGDRLDSITIIRDLHLLNYSIPVVFDPNSRRARRGDSWDQMEYRRHFVPFTGVLTYWAAYGTCITGLRGHSILKRFCGMASGLLRSGVTSFVAPKVSDMIFGRMRAKMLGLSDVMSTPLELDESSLNEWYESRRPY